MQSEGEVANLVKISEICMSHVIVLFNLQEAKHFENFEKMTHFDLWPLKVESHDKITNNFI